MWARDDHSPDHPRPASPWDEWTIPPKPADLIDTREHRLHDLHLYEPHRHEHTVQQLTDRSHGTRAAAVGISTTGTATTATATATARVPVAVRKPSPRPVETVSATEDAEVGELIGAEETAEAAEPFRPWRVDFDRPDVVEYPTTEPVEQPEPSRVARRLLMLLGLAYLFLTALASGLTCTGYFASADDDEGEEEHRDRPDDLPPRPRPPSRDPNAPGLHTRPDGTRYLVMPLPADLADRFRGNTTATAAVPAASAIGGGAL